MACKLLSYRNLFKFSGIFLALIMLLFSFASCDNNKDSFDEELLYGKWKSGTLYYRYYSDYTGITWDESDDVYEDEAQKFEWSLNNSVLKHIHFMEIGEAKIPKVYTVTDLTSKTLRYQDLYKSYYFTKTD